MSYLSIIPGHGNTFYTVSPRIAAGQRVAIGFFNGTSYDSVNLDHIQINYQHFRPGGLNNHRFEIDAQNNLILPEIRGNKIVTVTPQLSYTTQIIQRGIPGLLLGARGNKLFIGNGKTIYTTTDMINLTIHDTFPEPISFHPLFRLRNTWAFNKDESFYFTTIFSGDYITVFSIHWLRRSLLST